MNGLTLLCLLVMAGIAIWAATPHGARWTSGPAHPDITYPDWTPQEDQ